MSTDTSTQDMWDLKREMVIPITIDVEIQGLRVLDTLLWDSEQQQVSAPMALLVPSNARALKK